MAESRDATVEASKDKSEEKLEQLIDNVLDWQYMHGSLLKIPPDSGQVLARPIGAALFPTPFPRSLFEEANELQVIYNKLYLAVARDEEWLARVLCKLIDSDSLVGKLWRIYEEVKREGNVEPYSLAIFRSDYMQHVPCDSNGHPLPPQLKQVEFNTFSVAGGVHSARISTMHQYLNRTGAYKPFHPPITFPSMVSISKENRDTEALPVDRMPPMARKQISQSSLPANPTTDSIAFALLSAHRKYGSPKNSNATKTAILMPVQPNNVNICDERPIEELLWNHNVPTYRLFFGSEILEKTSLSPSKELLFRSPHSDEMLEISVVYYRAGYEEEEYTPTGIAARHQLERSKAIKCPSVLIHLAGSKKVQQKLGMPGVLERFLTTEEARRIRNTFMPIYPLDESEAGRKGRELALDRTKADKYILKPSLEGGGHNIYGSAIPEYLQTIPSDLWQNYILMEKIEAPMDVHNSLISFRELYSGPVISELGIFGICSWEEDGMGGVKMVENRQGGFSFKTKAVGVDEMSVVKGYGCFDSPLLV